MPPTPVYDDVLTRESSRRLAALIQRLPEPVALCGGHAVRYRVRDEWKRQFNQEYFGSRDIDVAYLVNASWTEQELRRSALGQAPTVLESIGYLRSGSYRFEAILDGKGNPLKEAPRSPAMIDVDYYYLYVDTLATAEHPRAKEAIGFVPIVEPALAVAFADPSQRTVMGELGPNVYLPSTPLLVATKLSSLPKRGEDGNKALKDLCDLYALTQYGGSEDFEIRQTVHGVLASARTLVDQAAAHPLLDEAAKQLDIEVAGFRAAVGPLAVPPVLKD